MTDAADSTRPVTVLDTDAEPRIMDAATTRVTPGTDTGADAVPAIRDASTGMISPLAAGGAITLRSPVAMADTLPTSSATVAFTS